MSSMYILVTIIFGVVAALVARSRGRSAVGWFLSGLFLGPFGLVVVALPPKPKEGEFVRCPACYEVIRAEATLCRYCGSRMV